MNGPRHDEWALRAPGPGQATSDSDIRQPFHVISHAIDLDLASDRASDRARSFARGLALASDLAVARARRRTYSRANYLVRNRYIGSAIRLATDLHLASGLADGLARELDRSLDTTLARDLAVRLTTVLERCRERAIDLGWVNGPGATQGQRSPAIRAAQGQRSPAIRAAHARQSAGVWLAPSARRLLVVVARLLPAADRARYGEEYISELWDIAYAGAGRRRQFQYATRQALRLVQLRGAVRAPRRRNVSP